MSNTGMITQDLAAKLASVRGQIKTLEQEEEDLKSQAVALHREGAVMEPGAYVLKVSESERESVKYKKVLERVQEMECFYKNGGGKEVALNSVLDNILRVNTTVGPVTKVEVLATGHMPVTAMAGKATGAVARA